eukprot:SAG31_NODE_4387_length_3279_cov_1.588994_2_plen_105_part_00
MLHIVATLAAVVLPSSAATLRVQLPDGPILCSSSGPRTTQCLGVPYATAGRWRRPARPEPWRAVRDATRAGPMCLQPFCYGGKGCYFLVFAPTIREIRDFYRDV